MVASASPLVVVAANLRVLSVGADGGSAAKVTEATRTADALAARLSSTAARDRAKQAAADIFRNPDWAKYVQARVDVLSTADHGQDRQQAVARANTLRVRLPPVAQVAGIAAANEIVDGQNPNRRSLATTAVAIPLAVPASSSRRRGRRGTMSASEFRAVAGAASAVPPARRPVSAGPPPAAAAAPPPPFARGASGTYL